MVANVTAYIMVIILCTLFSMFLLCADSKIRRIRWPSDDDAAALREFPGSFCPLATTHVCRREGSSFPKFWDYHVHYYHYLASLPSSVSLSMIHSVRFHLRVHELMIWHSVCTRPGLFSATPTREKPHLDPQFVFLWSSPRQKIIDHKKMLIGK